MKKTVFLFFALSFIVSSCKEPETPQGIEPHIPYQPTYEIGDLYRNDTLEGVVFYTYGAYNGLMVSLEETKLPWCDSAHIVSETGATNPYDGWNNTNIVTANYDLFYFPTIDWSYQRNTWHHIHYPHRLISNKQWYVPSSIEMRYLLMNQAAVNATLDSLGYPTLEDKIYWSSTETGTRGAAAVRLQDDEIIVSDAVKTMKYYVKAIRAY